MNPRARGLSLVIGMSFTLAGCVSHEQSAAKPRAESAQSRRGPSAGETEPTQGPGSGEDRSAAESGGAQPGVEGVEGVEGDEGDGRPLSEQRLPLAALPSDELPPKLLAGLQELTLASTPDQVCALYDRHVLTDMSETAKGAAFVFVESARLTLVRSGEGVALSNDDVAIYACKHLQDDGHCPGGDYANQPLAPAKEALIDARRKAGARIYLVEEGTVAVMSDVDNCLLALPAEKLPKGGEVWARAGDVLQELDGCYDGGFACEMSELLEPLAEVDDALAKARSPLLKHELLDVHRALMGQVLGALTAAVGMERENLAALRRWAKARPASSPIKAELTRFLQTHAKAKGLEGMDLGDPAEIFALYASADEQEPAPRGDVQP